MAGFEYRGTAYGGQSTAPRIPEYVVKDAETLRAGDMLNGEVVSGAIQVDRAVAADVALIGAAYDYVVSPAVAGAKVRVVSNLDAIYAIAHGTARKIGDFLKLGSGGSGQQNLVAATGGTDDQFEVIADNDASGPVIVRITPRAARLNSN